MKRLFLSALLGAAALLTCSCASTQRQNLQYSAPSVRPVQAAVETGQTHVRAAQSHVTKAQTHATTVKGKLADIEKALTSGPKTSPPPAPALMKLLDEARSEVDALTQELTETQAALADAQTALASAQTLSQSLQKQVNDQTTMLNKTIIEKNAALTERDTAVHAYHKLKFYACLLGAAAALFLLWKFKPFLAFLGPYAPLAFLVGPATLFGLLWLLL